MELPASVISITSIRGREYVSVSVALLTVIL